MITLTAFFDLSGVSDASIQSAGAWVTASDLSAASVDDGVGVLNASSYNAHTTSEARPSGRRIKHQRNNASNESSSGSDNSQ